MKLPQIQMTESELFFLRLIREEYLTELTGQQLLTILRGQGECLHTTLSYLREKNLVWVKA